MRVILSPEARLEFEEAERFYERQQHGLGKHFRAEVTISVSVSPGRSKVFDLRLFTS